MSNPEPPPLPARKKLPHDVPRWIDPSAEIYFITINSLPRGTNQLAATSTAHDLLQSAAHRHHAAKWFIHLFLLMRDHIRALLSFPQQGSGLQQTIKSWKSWTAKSLRIQWQRDFFEHRLRQNESASEKFHYILANPVRAGLTETPTEWPWLLWSDPRGGSLHQGWSYKSRDFPIR
jgi:putative transposase